MTTKQFRHWAAGRSMCFQFVEQGKSILLSGQCASVIVVGDEVVEVLAATPENVWNLLPTISKRKRLWRAVRGWVHYVRYRFGCGNKRLKVEE